MAIERSRIRWNGWGWAAHRDALGSREEVWSWLARQLGMPSLLATPSQRLEDVALPPSRLAAHDRAQFVALLGAERAREDRDARACHARGKSYHDLLHLRAGLLSTAPDIVLYPRAADETLSILRIAHQSGIAVVPYGGGTSVVGGVSASAPAFNATATLDLSGMDRVLDIDPQSGTARAEAGIAGPALEMALAEKGVTLGHTPQSFEFSTLGGWIAHRGAGQQSNRYGKAEDWLVAATLATPRGMLVTDSSPASASGPRLVDLIAGSEGIFGVITDATFRVRAMPEQVEDRAWLFRDFESGITAIRRAVQNEIPVSMLRLSDADETAFYRALSDIGAVRSPFRFLSRKYLDLRGMDDRAAALIASFEGSADGVASSRSRFAAIVSQLGGIALGRGPGRSWREGRFRAPYLRDPMLDRGLGVDTFETAATWAKLAGLHAAVREALGKVVAGTAPYPSARGIVMCHLSHSYRDGASLYFTCIFPRALGDEFAQWRAIKNAATNAIMENGGTLSHHHGVGEDHLPWMVREKGELGLDVLRAIKRALDPAGILNPGKLIPS
jgi:alkyldihydroxyacetonephosphate synthase